MKRLLSMVMALVLALGLLSGLAVSAGAEEIQTVVITGVTAPEVGQMTNTQVTVPEDAGYTAELQWYEYDYADESYFTYEGEFEAGKLYLLELRVEPKEGYTISPESCGRTFLVDGQIWEVSGWDGFVYADYCFNLGATVITQAELLQVSKPVAGQIADVHVVLPDDAPYRVGDSSYWRDQTGEEVTTFENGQEYYLELDLVPEEGYCFAQNVDIAAGDIQLDVWYNTETEMEMSIRFVLGIDQVEIKGIEKPVAGATPNTEVQVPQDAEYTVTGSKWMVENAGFDPQDPDSQQWIALTGAFADGNRYQLQIELTAESGSVFFPNSMDIRVDAPDCRSWGYQAFDEDTKLIVTVDYSLRAVLEKVELTVPELKTGDAVPTLQDIQVPENAGYQVVDLQVRDWYEDNYTVTTIEADHHYVIYIVLESVGALDFDWDTRVFLNGGHAPVNGLSDTILEIEHHVSTIPQIGKVELTVAEPAIGAVPKFKIPDDANYTIANQLWYNYQTGEDATAFEKGKLYRAEVVLRAKDGFEISQDAQALLNGKEWDDFYVDMHANILVLRQEVSFREKLTKVELPAWPSGLKAGDTVESGPVTVPEGSKYEAECLWLDDRGEIVTGTLKNGVNYTYIYMVFPKDGYEVDLNTAVTIGGEDYPYVPMASLHDLTLFRSYPIGMQVIDRIDLTLPEPKDGEKPGKVTGPEDAKYAVENVYWAVGQTDSLEDLGEMKEDETFANGKYYYLELMVDVDEGYALSNDAKVYVGGKECKVLMLQTAFGENQLVVELGKLEAPAPAPEKDPTMPPMGDGFPMAAVICLMVLCVSCVTLMVTTKERLVK